MVGSTSARGYSGKHVRLRKQWAAIVAAGLARCTRCGLPIAPWGPWDLDHSEDRTRWLGPAHRYCNRAAGARKKQGRLRSVSRPTVVDRW